MAKPPLDENKVIYLVSASKENLNLGESKKKGFIGPSQCYLYGSQEETMDHLLNLCPFTSNIWDWVASIFRQTNRDSLNISNTLKN